MEFYPLFFTGIGFMISATIIDNISKGSLKAFKVFFDQYYKIAAAMSIWTRKSMRNLKPPA